MNRDVRRVRLPLVLGTLALLVVQILSHAESPQLKQLRAQLEGSWELIEWHVDKQVLRPPQVGGRWSNHDGVITFIAFRNNGQAYEALSGYGAYELDENNWSYAYEGMQVVSGTSPKDASVTVINDMPSRSFKVTRRGEEVLLDRPNDHREYEDGEFRLMRDGKLLRKWRRIRPSSQF
ncbi:MAG: hypothetical protein GKR90_12915 [Pseudomonadales bacterium]|nr:hypothetical protein [Pseudomonadales bacterium]